MTEGMSLSQLNHPAINMNNTEVGHNPNDKNSGEEYFDRRGGNQQQQEDFQQLPFVDRTAQLRATLNSLAALNAANIVQKNKYKTNPIKAQQSAEKQELIKPIENSEDKQEEKEQN